MRKSIKIKIGDHYYWFLPDDETLLSGPIAPLEHCNKYGELDFFKCFESETFAHCSNGIINRYGKEIGRISDLIKIK